MPPHTLADMAKALNRPAVVVSGIQWQFKLPAADGARYTDSEARTQLDARRVQLGDKVFGAHLTQQASASASGVPLPHDYLAVDLSDLSGSCKCRVDGLIGADFFRERIVRLDFAAGELRILPAVPNVGAEEVPLQLRRGAMRVQVKVNEGPARWVRLDTGCASGLQWVAQGAESRCHAQRVAVALTPVSVSVASNAVQLGALRFDGVPTDLHQTPIFAGEAGLVGNGLISRFSSVTVDARGGRLLLQRPPTGR